MNNIYDNSEFFNAYSQMPRSTQGLDAAGEWHQLRPLFPELSGKRVLDLGCGYGWHCKFSAQSGAEYVLGIDLSQKMIERAAAENNHPNVEYRVCGIDEYDYPAESFHLVVSNLALHYLEDLTAVYTHVYKTLKPGGEFLFNIEHPVFTAGVKEDWIYDEAGAPLYWPVDNYYYSGKRVTNFLGQTVEKQHHTLSQILGGLLSCGFVLSAVEEAMPPEEMMDIPGMRDEMRRPMMLLVKAVKPC